MNLWRLTLKSLAFYWRSHLAVGLGVTIAGAVLTGALIVGDSVRYSLRAMALARLGRVHHALAAGDRFFGADLSQRFSKNDGAAASAVLDLPAIAIFPDKGTRQNNVHILGIDDSFWSCTGSSAPTPDVSTDWVMLNRRLAEALGAGPGNDLVLRVARPSLLPRDAGVGSVADASAALRLKVRAVLDDRGIGRFSLQAGQMPPFNAFVPLSLLQKRIDLVERANLLLVGEPAHKQATDVRSVQTQVNRAWRLSDYGLELHERAGGQWLELTTDRIFLDSPIAREAAEAAPGGLGVLTYFVNEIRVGERAAPYSMVSAIGSVGSRPSPVSHPLPADMKDDEIIINSWLAEDLAARPGDALTLRYFAVSTGRTLIEKEHAFRIRGVIPIEGSAADPTWTPKFPGLSDSENCRDWEPGVPLDLKKIRDKDEKYWDEYRTTPKAFLTLEAGRMIWENRFGTLTSIRYPLLPGVQHQITRALSSNITPESIGLTVQPVRAQALAAAAEAQDFGQLFLGFSFFLITAALILTGLLFVFGMGQRAEQIGTMLAVGWRPGQVRRLLWCESGLIAAIGSAAGVASSVVYARGVLAGLAGAWREAVNSAALDYHVRPLTLAIGFCASLLVGLLTLTLYSRRLTRRPARELLAGPDELGRTKARASRAGLWIAITSAVGALILTGLTAASGDGSQAGIFFGVGALLLMAGLSLGHWVLNRPIASQSLTLLGLGRRNVTRRAGRSLATIGLLACGCFLVVSVGANRKGPPADVADRTSGTGGFTFFGETTIPLIHDLNTPAGREAYNLDAQRLIGVSFVPLRVRAGEDASCLNLNRARAPRLLGIEPKDLIERGAFTFSAVDPQARWDKSRWELLDRADWGEDVPVVGDQATVVWGLGKKLGDSIIYTDERGRVFNARIVGLLAGSILQGDLIMSEARLLERYPSQSGYRVFLIDAPAAQRQAIKDYLMTTLADSGLELTLTAERLAAFQAVENTYLSVFQVLGGLGLLLGCAGLGMVVLRNVLERRGELALLLAVGFTRRRVVRLLLAEHWSLLLTGLLCGVVSGLIAVLPALRSPGAQVPYQSMGLTLAAVLVTGLAWIWVATRWALRGQMLSALANE